MTSKGGMHSFLDANHHNRPLRFFLRVNRATLPWLLLQIVLYNAGALVLLGASYYFSQIIDNLNTGSLESTRSLLFWLVGSFAAHEIFYRLGHICEIIVIARIRTNTKKALFDHTSSLSYGYFADRFAGEIAHKVNTTADAYERMLLVLTNNFATNIFLIFASVISLGLVHAHYAIFMASWWIIILIGSFFLGQRLNKWAGVFAAVEAKTTGAFVDTYANIATVKVYGRKESLRKAHTQVDAETRAYRQLGFWDVVTFDFQGLSLVGLAIGLIMISASLYQGGLITLGQIVFVATIVFLQLFNTVWDLGKNFAEFIRFRGEAAQNLADLVVAPTILDGLQTLTKKTHQTSIEYRNVTFGYVPESPILNTFSLTIRPGEKIGIVGLSGAGKTTFANLLLRFFDPQEGAILIDGQDSQDLTQESLRSRVSYISQDSSLFHASIAENIAYGVQATSLRSIQEAARLAYADEFIEQFPDGYQSVVGERGIKLSGGQRQRIAIARALLANRPLFLLDEATSALDSDSEAKIQKGLSKLMENKTVIAIAHRLSTLSRMDRIVFLEKGKIIEDGTHEELLAKRNGKYAKLWHMQAGGFLPDVPNL